MKPTQTRFRFFLPTAAFFALSTCMAPLAVQGSPGHSSVSADFRSYASHSATERVSVNSDADASDAPYGFDAGGAFYQPVGDLDAWINRANRYYNRYRGQNSNRRYYDRDNRNSRSYRGYYPNDPDDRNNPRHPDYIGPPGSYPRGYRGDYYRGSRGYYPNDPDDRNNPNHPDYIGRSRWGR